MMIISTTLKYCEGYQAQQGWDQIYLFYCHKIQNVLIFEKIEVHESDSLNNKFQVNIPFRFGWILTRSMRSPMPTPGLTSGSWSRTVSWSRSPLLSTPGPEWEPTTRPGERVVIVGLVRGREQQTPEPARRNFGCREWEFWEDSSRDTGTSIV